MIKEEEDDDIQILSVTRSLKRRVKEQETEEANKRRRQLEFVSTLVAKIIDEI